MLKYFFFYFLKNTSFFKETNQKRLRTFLLTKGPAKLLKKITVSNIFVLDSKLNFLQFYLFMLIHIQDKGRPSNSVDFLIDMNSSPDLIINFL